MTSLFWISRNIQHPNNTKHFSLHLPSWKTHDTLLYPNLYNMAKITIKWPFWAVPNAILNDKNLSMKAKWLFCYIQSKPWDWDFSSARIALETSDGIDGIKAWLIELEKNWYLRRERRQDLTLEYFLFQDKNEEEKPTKKNATEENTPMENTARENPTSNKTIYTKKDYKKKYNKKENIIKEKDDGFSFFWEKYPSSRRQRKDNCFSFFMKQKKEIADLVLQWLEKWIEYWNIQKTEERYIPHSSTFLSKKYYENPPKISTKNPLTSDSKDYLLWF